MPECTCSMRRRAISSSTSSFKVTNANAGSQDSTRMPFRAATSPISRFTSSMDARSDELKAVELFIPVALDHSQALLRHYRERAIFDCFRQRELSRDHIFEIPAECVLIQFLQMHRTADFGCALLKS